MKTNCFSQIALTACLLHSIITHPSFIFVGKKKAHSWIHFIIFLSRLERITLACEQQTNDFIQTAKLTRHFSFDIPLFVLATIGGAIHRSKR